MKLGAFSVSLSVKNIKNSKVFYQKLGFEVIGGKEEENWLILRNNEHTIGLFQEMFKGNILTFNPGWDKECKTLESFDDVRDLVKEFESKGIKILDQSINGESGPSSFSIKDPDGNVILIDQHV